MKDSDVLLQWINDNFESTTNIKDNLKLKDVFNLVKDSENLTDMKKAEKRVITYAYFQSKLLANLFLSKLVRTNSDKTYCLYKIKVAEKHKIEQINNKILQKFLLFESRVRVRDKVREREEERVRVKEKLDMKWKGKCVVYYPLRDLKYYCQKHYLVSTLLIDLIYYNHNQLQLQLPCINVVCGIARTVLITQIKCLLKIVRQYKEV